MRRVYANGRTAYYPPSLQIIQFCLSPKAADLLHLAIRESTGDRQRFDLLLTDLPGEWTVVCTALAMPIRSSSATCGRHHPGGGSGRCFIEWAARPSPVAAHTAGTSANEVKVSVDTPFVVVGKCSEIDMQMLRRLRHLAAYVQSLGYRATTRIAAASFETRSGK